MIQYSRYHKNSIMILNSLLSRPEISGPAKASSESLKNLTISNEKDGPLSKVDLDDIDLITAIQAEEILNIIYSRGPSVEGFLEESELNQNENTNPIFENDWTLDTTIHSSILEKEAAIKNSEDSSDECYNKEFEKNSRIVGVESRPTVHERKNPIQCVICDRKYATKHLLKYHINEVHEGKKPFKCSACNRCFSRNFSLKQHSLFVHGLKQYINELFLDLFQKAT